MARDKIIVKIEYDVNQKFYKRPNKDDYTTTNQIEYQESLNKYYEALEQYCDHLESSLKIT